MNINYIRQAIEPVIKRAIGEGNKLIPVEVKSYATSKPAMGKQIRSFRENLADKVKSLKN